MISFLLGFIIGYSAGKMFPNAATKTFAFAADVAYVIGTFFKRPSV